MEKEIFITRVCCTELVYDRIRKKLNVGLNNLEIEKMLVEVISDSETFCNKKGKNYYVGNTRMNIEITINSNNYRIITASRFF